MDVTPLVKQGAQIIQSYAGGKFRVSGQVYDQAVFVMPDGVERWDVRADNAKDLSAEDFDPLTRRAAEIDVVLLGSGARMSMLSVPVKNALRDKGLSVESMDTGAACRTYNVLLAEGRRVVAALLPVAG